MSFSPGRKFLKSAASALSSPRPPPGVPRGTASANSSLVMVDPIPPSPFDGNAARDTLPPDAPAVRVAPPPVSRPFAVRARIPSVQAASERDEDGLRAGFISDQRLADLLFRRVLKRVGPGVVEADGCRYALHNAVRVLGRHGSDTSDPYGLTSTVERFEELQRAGARFDRRVMHLGSAAYRVERGVVAVEQTLRVPPPSGVDWLGD